MKHADHHAQGIRDGLAAWRPNGKHEIPADHPPGSTPEGSAWFRGCLAGLKHAERVAYESEPQEIPA